MPNENEDPKPVVRKTWLMIKKAINTPTYATNGLVAHFSGEDDYKDGAWVSRVGDYKFTPVSTNTAPIWDNNCKYYQAVSAGGMTTNLKIPAGGNFSFEVVTRDVKNLANASGSSNYGTLVGCSMSSWSMQDGGIALIQSSGTISFTMPQVKGYGFKSSSIKNNTLDTFAMIPGVGIFHNGEYVGEAGESPYERDLGLFTHIGGQASTYRGKGKIHAVRFYNRKLTPEEVKNNYLVDVEKYNFHTDTKNYVTEGLEAFYAGYMGTNSNMWMEGINYNNITLYNNPVFDNEKLCYSFNGSNQYGRAKFASIPSGDFTFETYVSVPESGSATSFAPIFFGGNYGWDAGYGCTVNLKDNNAFTIGGFIENKSATTAETLSIQPSVVAAPNTKIKIVFRRRQSDGLLDLTAQSINGIEHAQSTGVTAALVPVPATLGIGAACVRDSQVTQYCKYSVYCVRVYNRFLTDEEIKQNYQEDIKIYGE